MVIFRSAMPNETGNKSLWTAPTDNAALQLLAQTLIILNQYFIQPKLQRSRLYKNHNWYDHLSHNRIYLLRSDYWISAQLKHIFFSNCSQERVLWIVYVLCNIELCWLVSLIWEWILGGYIVSAIYDLQRLIGVHFVICPISYWFQLLENIFPILRKSQ